MIKTSGVFALAFLLLGSFPLHAQKKSPAPSIRFQGAPQYSQQELFAAAGLKPDARLKPAEVKAHAKLLNDTGLFREIKFATSGKALVFTLTPSSQLYPLHLDNVPLTPGADLDAQLHDRFPLYHGLLPASGSLVDGLCRAFEQMLAAKGVKTTVKAALVSGLGPRKLTAVNFSVDSPSVHIGRIQLAGVSPAMQPKAALLATGQTGSNFDTENSAPGLRHVFEDLYQDQGYAAVQVHVVQADPVAAPDQSVEIPYAVTIDEGGIYKLGTIDLPSGSLVARAAVDKMLAQYKPGSGRPLDLFVQAVYDAHKALGYLDCSVVLHPSFSEATHIVNYSLEIAPGTQYRFASVQFDGAPAAMAARLKLAWKMAPGDVFDASYFSGFLAQAQKKDKQLTKWLQTVIASPEIKPDPAAHQVNCFFHFAKAAPNPR